MLKEYQNVRQIPGEDRRRWFSDDYFDLIVWVDHQNAIVGFELCYDANKNPHALTWHKELGFAHHRIDDGESRPGKAKASPILMPDGWFDHATIARRLQHASQEIDPAIAQFVHDKILHFSARPD
jgi:hypothetical protein